MQISISYFRSCVFFFDLTKGAGTYCTPLAANAIFSMVSLLTFILCLAGTECSQYTDYSAQHIEHSLSRPFLRPWNGKNTVFLPRTFVLDRGIISGSSMVSYIAILRNGSQRKVWYTFSSLPRLLEITWKYVTEQLRYRALQVLHKSSSCTN